MKNFVLFFFVWMALAGHTHEGENISPQQLNFKTKTFKIGGHRAITINLPIDTIDNICPFDSFEMESNDDVYIKHSDNTVLPSSYILNILIYHKTKICIIPYFDGIDVKSIVGCGYSKLNFITNNMIELENNSQKRSFIIKQIADKWAILSFNVKEENRDLVVHIFNSVQIDSL